ncbi:alpha/beta-hydrolase [Lojkania enalia]|uniref:Alpha/beta-hydrolase n=1 Tax=Lojkania enalia TaxID=147567 RepID=A0A9P4K2A0_9PLEO|nr:alpha/beta-hydrolase [Didymosphaeria enalia]
MWAAAALLQDEKFKTLGFEKTIMGCVSDGNPVLVLFHGYPQSSYIRRHLIPLLPPNAPLFIPDLPGYSLSAPISQNDKLAVGKTCLSALKTQIQRSTSGSSSLPVPIILIGHDRGARIAHHLAVHGASEIKIKAACFIDILPTTSQWRVYENAKAAAGSFHWPFLANVSLATRMIRAFGGDNWGRELLNRWAGSNLTRLETLKADRAFNVYAGFLTEDSVVEATCRDYEAGASRDVEMLEEDEQGGRKVECPVLLLYGKDYIGGECNIKAEWEG